MPFTLVDIVKIADVDKAREGLLSQVITGMKQSPGFVHGTWSADREADEGPVSSCLTLARTPRPRRTLSRRRHLFPKTSRWRAQPSMRCKAKPDHLRGPTAQAVATRHAQSARHHIGNDPCHSSVVLASA